MKERYRSRVVRIFHRVAWRVKLALHCAIVEHSQTPERADPVTRVLASRVAELRRAVGMSQAALGVRMAGLRDGWSRSTVAKLEKNLRETLSVGDLLALSVALDTPLASLIADPRSVATVPVAKDLEPDAWAALLWLTGSAQLEHSRLGNFDDAARLIEAGREIVSQLGELRRQDRAYVRDVDGTLAHSPDGALLGDPDEARRLTDERHRTALLAVASALSRIERLGAPPPPLGAHVIARAAELGVEIPGRDG